MRKREREREREKAGYAWNPSGFFYFSLLSHVDPQICATNNTYISTLRLALPTNEPATHAITKKRI